MYLTRKHLSRRTVLRGAGVAVGLPLLDAMVPAATALAATAAAPALRAGFFYIPHGAIMWNTSHGPEMDHWTPSGAGEDFRLSPIMAPLERFKHQVTSFSNLENKASQNSVHAVNPATWLSGARPDLSAPGASMTPTIDQIIAERIGGSTPLPSLEVASETTIQVAACSGGSGGCYYSSTLSFRNATSPLPMEFNPRKVFNQLFGEGDTPEERAAIAEQTRSLLDLIADRTEALKRSLGPGDRVALDEYLDTVREIERRVERAEQRDLSGIELPDAPIGELDAFDDQVRLMFDLIALSFQANLTRVASYIMVAEGTNRTYNHIGVPDAFHPLSHHANNRERLLKLVRIQTYHMERFADFLAKLASIPDGEGSLLDHSLFLYGSNMSNSDRHNNYPLPNILVGGACGAVAGGRHIDLPEHTTLSNLLLTVLNKAGLEATSFADSTGAIAGRLTKAQPDVESAMLGQSPQRRAPRRIGRRATTLASTLAAALALADTAAADDSLARAIQDGDRDAALRLLEAGADVNGAQGDGTTPLHWAVYKVDRELAAALIARGARTDVVNRYGSSPLAEAAKLADAELAALLLDAGADPEAPNQDGQTTLMLAARAGALEVAKLLLARGAAVDTRETWRGQTALMWAADGAYPELVELLIGAGADVHLRAATNEWQAQVTSEPRAQYRPTGGLTPLLYSARSGCTPCTEALLDAGADIDRPNPDGVTPLMVAIDNFRFDTAKSLLERGANPHRFDWWGRTPLYVAVDMSSFSGRRNLEPERASDATSAHDIVTLLLAAGVEPNPQLNMHRPGRGGNSSRFVDDLLTTGATPLLRAAIGHDIEVVRALLDGGARVDLPNIMGVTPLMAAAGMGVSGRDRRLDLGRDIEPRAIATLEVLLAAGAEINARVTDITSRSARIARASTMTEREGQTALYGAVKFGWARVVEFLLAHGAEVDIVDALGRSPLDAATGAVGGRDNTVSQEVADILRNAGAGGV